MRQLFAWAGIPVKIFDDALKIFATALILSASVGADLKTSILVCGGITVTYTILGGLWALVITDYVQFVMKITAMLLLLPLALWHAGGPMHAFQGLPPGFLHFKGGPYGWTYLLSFSLIVIVSYNATWALAQKYYSVPDERSASKAAYLSAALNFVGTPLMLLPAIIGRKLLPDLLAQGHTADTYVLLVLKLLPAGVIGIIVAAMFSATMAAISADLNAIASVSDAGRLSAPCESGFFGTTASPGGKAIDISTRSNHRRPESLDSVQSVAIVISFNGDGLRCLPGAHTAAGSRRADNPVAYMERRSCGFRLGDNGWIR